MMITLFVALLPSLVYLAMSALDWRSAFHADDTRPVEIVDCTQIGRVYIHGVGECVVVGPTEVA